MSDVSGIPYMGPMGQGNFFAPSFSYNPQMSAGQIQSSYMPQYAQGQNTLQNLYASGGGFGQQTNYYSGLGAQYSAAGMSPYGIFTDPGYGGGGGASPYQTSPNVWDTGASPFQGGGGSSGFGGSIYDFGSLGSLGASPYQTSANVFDSGSRGFQFPGAGAIDWGGLAQNFQQPQAGNFGASMFGGLGGGDFGRGPSSQVDWGGLFGGGGAAARADPYPGMAMPGGLGSAMSTPREPAIDWAQASAPRADPAPGMAMPGGLNSPMTTQAPAADFSSRFGNWSANPFDTGTRALTGTAGTGPYGGGAGIDTGSFDLPHQQPLEPNQYPMFGSPVTEAYNPYFGATSPYDQVSGDQGPGPRDTRTGTLAPGGGLSAAELGDQARTQLAELMNAKAAIPSPVEAPAEAIPLPRERPAEASAASAGAATSATELYPGANPPRPPGDVPAFPAAVRAPNGQEPEAFVVHHTSGRGTPENIVNDWRTNRPGIGTQYIMDRNGVIHDVAAEYGYRGTGQAKDVTIQGAQGLNNRNIVGMEIIARDDKDVTPAQIAALKQFADTRYPNTPFYGHGEMSTNKERTEGQTGAQAILDARIAAGQGVFPSSSDFWDKAAAGSATSGAVPLPTARPAEAPPSESRVNQDQNIPRPPADIPAPPSGVERAQTFLNRSVESILQQHSPENLSRAGWVMDLKQPMREALNGPFGSQILSGLQPKLGELGLTRADFAKAVADPRARFGGEFGGMGSELPSPGAFTPFEGFRQSPDFENRTGEQLGRDQLAQLQTRGTSYEPGPEVASTPLGTALGLGDLPVPQAGAAAGMARPQGFVGEPSGAADVIGPRGSAFGFEPSGFGKGGYGNAFAPTQTAQQGPTMPSWQASLPPAYRSPEVISAIQTQADRFGIPPEAIPAVAGVEGSGWNPQYMTGSHAGIFQIAPDDFRTAGGTLGGLTYDQYRNATPAQQVAAYGDYIASSPNAAYLDAASGDPALAAALLQGIQFSPQGEGWTNRFLGGDTSSRVTPRPQAHELGNTSIDAMRDAFARRIAGWPQTQTLPGGR